MTTLETWHYPRDYIGADLSGMLIVPVGQSRDSDALERSNFRTALDRLGGESETVQVHSFGHWAVGWVESILLTPDSPHIAEAERIAAELADYPVLDNEDYSNLEFEEASEYWRRLSLSERIRLCTQFGLSIFAARRTYVPDDGRGDLDQYLRGD